MSTNAHIQEPEGLRFHFRKHFLLAYPVILSQLGHMLVGTADSLMVGRLGGDQLAAVSLSMAVMVFGITFGIGLSNAISPLVAQADGNGNVARLRQLLRHGVFTNTLGGVVLGLVIVGLVFLVPYFGQDASVVAYAQPYLLTLGASMVPFMVFQAFRQYAEGLGYTRQAMVIIISTNVLNVMLNYLFIYGNSWLGLPRMELLGAGYATLIARVVQAFTMFAYVRYSKRFGDYWPGFTLRKLSRPILRKLTGMGLVIGLQSSFEGLSFAMCALMMGWLGANTQAAHQVAINLSANAYMIALGVAAATTIRVGNQFGRRDFATLRIVARMGFIMVTAFMVLTAALFLVFRNWLPTLYVTDQAVIAVAANLLIMSALFQLSDGLQAVGMAACRGLNDVRVPMYIALVAYWGLGTPLSYVLGFYTSLGPIGIWAGLVAGLTASAIALQFRLRRQVGRLEKKNAGAGWGTALE